MAIQQPMLPFAIDDLEPYMSKATLEFHFGKHHKKYVDTTNKLIKGTELDSCSLEEIVKFSYGKKQKLYNNSAQVWNHNFFWQCLKNNHQTPNENLSETLAHRFGSIEEFKKKFTKEAKKLFGSGYVWLLRDKQYEIQIRSTQNADSPIAVGETPLLTCDVWEHAYYLDYQNERPKFLENFWAIVNWDFVEKNLQNDIEKELKIAV